MACQSSPAVIWMSFTFNFFSNADKQNRLERNLLRCLLFSRIDIFFEVFCDLENRRCSLFNQAFNISNTSHVFLLHFLGRWFLLKLTWRWIMDKASSRQAEFTITSEQFHLMITRKCETSSNVAFTCLFMPPHSLPRRWSQSRFNKALFLFTALACLSSARFSPAKVHRSFESLSVRNSHSHATLAHPSPHCKYWLR